MQEGKPGPVIPERYEKALGGDHPKLVLAMTPDAVRRLVRGLSEKELGTPPAPGKWSIKQIVAHLGDAEVMWGARYRMIAAHDSPPIPSFDQDLFQARLGVDRATTADLLDDFSMARANTLGLLERLPDESLDRVGIHAERGEESIRTMMALAAGHDRVHLQQLETIRVGLFPAKKSAPRKAGRAKKATKAKPAKKAAKGKPAARAAKPVKRTAKKRS